MRTGKNILLPGLFVIASCGTPEGLPQISGSTKNDTAWNTRSSESASPDIVQSVKDAHKEPASEKMNRPMDEFYRQALYENESDDQRRLEAVTILSLYRESAVVDVLIQAASDPRPEIRYRAVQTLGYAAADGLDRDGRITVALEHARNDSEQFVATLAESALCGLKQTEERGSQPDTQVPH